MLVGIIRDLCGRPPRRPKQRHLGERRRTEPAAVPPAGSSNGFREVPRAGARLTATRKLRGRPWEAGADLVDYADCVERKPVGRNGFQCVRGIIRRSA
jgi:hypothetical protein